MRQIALKILKSFLVIVIASVFVAAGIKAGDKALNLGANIIGIISKETGPCPEDMVFVPSSGKGFCIDKYEASAGPNCPFLNPQNQAETKENLDYPGCQPTSRPGAPPWRFISQNQAVLACAKIKKRLPTNQEWYQTALGTPDKFGGPDDCFLGFNPAQVFKPALTGSQKNCVSYFGAFDMIGNVWEWVKETIKEGEYKEMPLPPEGFIKSVDEEGLPAETDPQTPDANYGNDYFWIQTQGVRGIMRGGWWGRGEDMGVYSIFAASPPSFFSQAVGFRCAK